jgi:hypothetical protein
LEVKRSIVIGLVVAALVAVPAAFADSSSTVLGAYGSSASKPVVKVKGTTGSSTTGSSTTASSTTASPKPSTLPFTGSDLAVFVVAGGVLIAVGFGLRRFGRNES